MVSWHVTVLGDFNVLSCQICLLFTVSFNLRFESEEKKRGLVLSVLKSKSMMRREHESKVGF